MSAQVRPQPHPHGLAPPRWPHSRLHFGVRLAGPAGLEPEELWASGSLARPGTWQFQGRSGKSLTCPGDVAGPERRSSWTRSPGKDHPALRASGRDVRRPCQGDGCYCAGSWGNGADGGEGAGEGRQMQEGCGRGRGADRGDRCRKGRGAGRGRGSGSGGGSQREMGGCRLPRVHSGLGTTWVLRAASVGHWSTGSSRGGPGRGPGGFGVPLLMRCPGTACWGSGSRVGVICTVSLGPVTWSWVHLPHDLPDTPLSGPQGHPSLLGGPPRRLLFPEESHGPRCGGGVGGDGRR